jgi:hypothetical protein
MERHRDGETDRLKDKKTQRSNEEGDKGGEMERWRDGEMERWRDGEMVRWRDGEMRQIIEETESEKQTVGRLRDREMERCSDRVVVFIETHANSLGIQL